MIMVLGYLCVKIDVLFFLITYTNIPTNEKI